jgi:protein-S-isoprenylcysteine O-methyltransferase Ste14
MVLRDNSLMKAARDSLNLPSLLLAVFCLVGEPTILSVLVGASVAVVGLLFCVWANGYGSKAPLSIVFGPHRFVRQPVVFGTLAIALGLCLGGRNPWVTALSLTVVLVGSLRVMAESERERAQNLGPLFAEYREAVPLLIPTLNGFQGDSRWRMPYYSLRQALFHPRRGQIRLVVEVFLTFGILYGFCVLPVLGRFRTWIAAAVAAILVFRFFYNVYIHKVARRLTEAMVSIR